jgi:KDO2-lipid IV(A) lauroyltransferase
VKKIINYLIQSVLIYFLFFVGRILGLKISRIIFSNLFLLFGSFFKSKKVIKKNLDIFSQNVTDIDQKKIIEAMWKNYGMTFIEYIFLNYFRKQNSHITLEGYEIISKIIEEQKPVIFISGHFANFELMSMEITKRNIPLATIYRPLNNFFLNPFMEYLREKYVCKNQIKKGIKGVRETINYINTNHSVALMIDQRVSEGEKIDFFNNSSLTTTLPAQLSIKFDLDIVPVFIKRTKKNDFVLKFQNKISPRNFSNKIDLSKKLNEVLEKMVIKNPEQWIWTHNRWK